MRITEIVAKHIEMTEAIRDFVERKFLSLERLCEGYSPCDLVVEIGKTSEHHQKGDIWRAAVSLTIPGKMFRIERITDDMYKAVDQARDALKEEIIEHKERSK